MSWVRVALGLIREAVGADAGKEVLNNIRGNAPEPSAQTPVDIDALLAEHRAQVNRNLETMARMLNAQNEKLTETIRRQRIWNVALAAGLVIAIVAALWR